MQLLNSDTMQKEIVFKTSLLLIGIALNALEFFIPRIPLFPWLKPGLANIITLIWIIRYGFIESLLYALLRIWIVSFYFGFSFFTFSLGISGAMCACCAMWVFWIFLGTRRIMGTVGIAVVGAVFHNMGQLFAVYLLMAQNTHLFYQIPVMLIASVVFGGIVGAITPVFVQVLAEKSVMQRVEQASFLHDTYGIRFWQILVSSFFLAGCIALVFITQRSVLLVAAVFITFFVQGLMRGSLHALIYPLKRFWLLFLFVGILHGFFTYGTKVPQVPWITYEGSYQTIIQWLRLWTWLETTFIFLHFRFHIALLKILQKVFTGNRSTLYAGLLAVEFFPSAVAVVQHKSGALLKTLFRKPSRVVDDIFTGIIDTIIAGSKRE